jgi:hypothetical protein
VWELDNYGPASAEFHLPPGTIRSNGARTVRCRKPVLPGPLLTKGSIPLCKSTEIQWRLSPLIHCSYMSSTRCSVMTRSQLTPLAPLDATHFASFPVARSARSLPSSDGRPLALCLDLWYSPSMPSSWRVNIRKIVRGPTLTIMPPSTACRLAFPSWRSLACRAF